MNDWDLMFKDVLMYSDEEPEPETEDFELPEGYSEAEFPGDDYGFYGKDPEGTVTLIRAAMYDKRTSYCIQDGCERILEDAFSLQPVLSSIFIPASVREIPEGALSSSGSWAETDRGITDVAVDEKNPFYFADETGLYERKQDGSRKLLLWLGKEKTAVISETISEIGQKAFYGRDIDQVRFEKEGYTFEFPKHKYFREELLKQFGKNGKIYDFSEYDSFLLRKHYNAERIRMLCERLERPMDLSEEMRDRLIMHLRDAMDKVITGLAEENAIFELKYMAKIGIFTEDNISEAIEVLNRTDKREMLTYLMDHKNEHFSCRDFDFSI